MARGVNGGVSEAVVTSLTQIADSQVAASLYLAISDDEEERIMKGSEMPLEETRGRCVAWFHGCAGTSLWRKSCPNSDSLRNRVAWSCLPYPA